MLRFTRTVSTFSVALVSALAFGSEPEKLQTLLEKEASGVSVNRQLADGSQPPDSVSAWQAGMIKLGDAWQSIDELSRSTGNDAYLAKREEIKNSPQAHLKLARWCVHQQLPELARAHYFGVLAAEPNNLEARAYVKHVLVGDTWFAQADLDSAQQEMRNTFDSLEEWTPKIKLIVQELQSGRAQAMSDAIAELEKVDTKSALSALEFFASNIDDDLAKPLIRKIVKERSQESCAALVRIALAHPSADVQAIATEAIRKYPEAYYIPDLVGTLSGEIQVENQLVVQPNGNIGLVTVFRNELQNRKQLQRAQKLVSVVARFSSTHSAKLFDTTTADFSYWSVRWKVPKESPVKLGSVSTHTILDAGSASSSRSYVPKDVAASVEANLREQGKQVDREVAQKNRQRMTDVNRVCTLLRAITGATFGDEPEKWWNWWNDRTERYQGNKPTAWSYSEQREKLVVSSYNYSNIAGKRVNDLGPIQVQYSCLVAGTLIQTSTGLVPVESVQIGDLVVSQNVETAELTLKPVILTTVRPPKTTIKIKAGSETIEATGGHLWWVSGHGWVKSRELKPGMLLHTATGTTEVEETIENPTPQPTYNLVVDEFHTYFVGPQRVLSYDNTLLKPTLRQVPGYGLISDVHR